MQTEQLRADADFLDGALGLTHPDDWKDILINEDGEAFHQIAERLREAARALDNAPSTVKWNGSGWVYTGEPT